MSRSLKEIVNTYNYPRVLNDKGTVSQEVIEIRSGCIKEARIKLSKTASDGLCFFHDHGNKSICRRIISFSDVMDSIDLSTSEAARMINKTLCWDCVKNIIFNIDPSEKIKLMFSHRVVNGFPSPSTSFIKIKPKFDLKYGVIRNYDSEDSDKSYDNDDLSDYDEIILYTLADGDLNNI